MVEKTESDNRSLELIRELMQIHFTFGHNAELFQRKFREIIHIKSLKERGIIEVGEHILDDALRAKIAEKNLNPGEIEMCCLKKQGFAPEEIAVILGFKSKRSVHVKQSRIKKKLKGTSLKGGVSPEILLIILFTLIIIRILIFVFFDIFYYP